MKHWVVGIALICTGAAIPTIADAVAVGQIDTFQTGTTDNWTAGGVLGKFPPTPPFVTTTGGGPQGAGDQFLVITSTGIPNAPGSAVAAFNRGHQWAGNYLASGIQGISLELLNMGATDLTIRLRIEDPAGGPPTDEAISTFGAVLSPGSGWTHVVIPTGLTDWNPLSGTVSGALSKATALWIISNPSDASDYFPIAGQLGVDDIAAVPEPASGLLMAAGLFGLAAMSRRSLARAWRARRLITS